VLAHGIKKFLLLIILFENKTLSDGYGESMSRKVKLM